MAGSFEERERAFEAKWAHDEELQFRVIARRNKLLGLWAAGRLGLAGEKAQAYARDVVAADLAVAGDSDLIAKLLQDFERAGVPVPDATIRREIETLFDAAKIEIAQELK